MNDDQKRIERMKGLLREMKAAMLGYPQSMRAMTPTTLLRAINAELQETDVHPKDSPK